MSFAFNFDHPNGKCSKQSTQSTDDHDDVNQSIVKPAVEVNEFDEKEIFDKMTVKSMEFGDCVLNIVDTSYLEQLVLNDEELQKLVDTSSLSQAVSSHSDLVAGTYEGGLKIWECALDLTEFLCTKLENFSISVKDKSVLELGCGAGLPGLFCLKNGAKQVHFQDYNEEVLKLLTCANVRLCAENADCRKQCRYFSGDWSSLADLAIKEQLRYDIVLTAETIYNVENYSKLHILFSTVLEESGCIILAAKSYYFGVGGSVEGFLEYVGSRGVFSSEIVHTVSKGVPRYIILLKRMKTNKEENNSLEQADTQSNSSVMSHADET